MRLFLMGHGLAWVAAWTVCVGAATASAATSASASGPASGSRFHIDVGLGAVAAESTRFRDVRSSSETDLPVLYGSASRYTAGRFDVGAGLRLGVGYDWTPRLRALLEVGFDPDLRFDGNANYVRSGARQPSTAELSTRRLLLAGRYEVWSRKVAGSDRPLGFYVGAGVGVTEYRLTSFVQRFPALRRGPGGEVPFTRLPSGRDRERTLMLGLGVTVPVGRRNTLDFGYRYLDGGDVRTDVGDIDVVRYRTDGSRREIAIGIDRTAADFNAHVLTVTWRRRWGD